MNILEESRVVGIEDNDKVTYKTTFTTDDGIIHRVDFDEDGKIDNLCEYTGFNPNMKIEDLSKLIDEIKVIINK